MWTYLRFLLFFLAGLFFTLFSFIGIAFACVFLIVFYCLYRFFWLFSGAASKERAKNRFEKRQKKLLLKARKKRLDYSNESDQRDVEELIQQINGHLQIHQQYIDAHLIDELHYLLGRYQQGLKFDKTLHIHAIVTKTDAAELNAVLSDLLNDMTILD